MPSSLARLTIFFLIIMVLTGLTLNITRANEVDPCSPINNLTEVHQEKGSDYWCSDLRDAIEKALPGGNIRLRHGVYVLPDNYTLLVNKDLHIFGSNSQLSERPTENFTELIFNNEQDYGLTLGNGANVTISNLIITSKNQGILYAKNAGHINLYNNIFDGGTSSIGVYNSSGVDIAGNTIINSQQPIEIQYVSNVKIHQNTIKNSYRGILLLKSSASIISNLIENSGVQNASIFAAQSLDLTVTNNTVVQNSHSNYEYAIDIASATQPVNILKNIVVGEHYGMRANNLSEQLINFTQNNFVNTKANYVGISDQTGMNGNISADPRFGDNYCLNENSPSVLDNGTYMGFNGLCNYISPTPDYHNPLSRVDIQPTSLKIEVNSDPIDFSAEAVIRGGGNSNEVSYEWGMSSLGSIGILTQNKENQKLAKFTPIRPGNADVWVIARIGDFMVQRSVPVVVERACQERSSCTDEACLELIPTGGWCASEVLPGDIDFNNTVDQADISLFKEAFGTTFYSADINFDGKVNIYDYLYIVKNFGTSLDQIQ